MTTSNVVVMFPKMKKEHPPQNIAEMQEEIDNLRKSKAEITLDALTMTAFETLAVCGVDVNSENGEYMKNIFWMIESMRSLIYKKLSIPHEFHDITENFYVTTQEGSIVSCIGQFEKLKLVE